MLSFHKEVHPGSQLQEELAIARKHYQLSVLCSTFDFSDAINSCKELGEYLEEHDSSFNEEAVTWTTELLQKLEMQQETATKFQQQLQYLFQQTESPEENKPLQERIAAAAKYFAAAINNTIQFLQQSPAITDSKLYSKEYNDSIKEVFAGLALKKYMQEGFNEKFDMEDLSQKKTKICTTLNQYKCLCRSITEKS